MMILWAPGAVVVPDDIRDKAEMGDDRVDAGADDDPQEPREPMEPGEIILQGFWTVSQTLSVAYGAASAQIQILIRKSLAKTTAKDKKLCVWGLQVHSPMDRLRQAGNGLLGAKYRGPSATSGEAWQAGKDVLNNILTFIPEDEDPPKLTPIFPQATHLLAPALVVARWYTDEAL